MLRPLAIAGALVFAAPAKAQLLTELFSYQYGYYQTYGTGRISDFTKQRIPRTPYSEWRHIRTSQTIVAHPSAVFGFRYWLIGVWGARVPITYVVRFPPQGMIPGIPRKPIFSDEATDYVTVGSTGSWYWGFESSIDIVAGKWTIELWSNGRKLVEETFFVISPLVLRRDIASGISD
jgi:hypothetical protein